MNIVELLQICAEQKIQLWVEEDRLKYRAHKGVITAELREQIGRKRDELIDHLRSHKPSVVGLSYGQRALWFQQQLAPQSAAYNIGLSARVVSAFDMKLFANAVEQLVGRHPVLNSVYRITNGEPYLHFDSSMAPLFVQHNAEKLCDADLVDAVMRCNQQPFDLENGPIVRTHLFTRADSDHVLLLSVPHIACDGWSMGILIRELCTLCESLAGGQPADLARISCNYTDFIEAQHRMLSGSEGERLKRYWTEQLAGEIPVLDLPLTRPRPPARSYEGATSYFEIGDGLYRQIKALAQSENTTLYTVLVSAFQVLLMRYTGGEDVLIGTPMAGRNQAEYETVIGNFINQVVIRSNLSGNPTFRGFLDGNRRVIIGAMEHQAYPFPLLVQQLRAQRDPSCHPIFQIIFNLIKQSSLGSIDSLLDIHATDKPMDFGPFKLKPFPIPQQEGQFDLALEMIYSDRSLVSALRYCTDVFSAETISRMGQHFRRLLESIVADPDCKLYDLPFALEQPDNGLHVVSPQNQFVFFGKEEIEQSIAKRFEAQLEKHSQKIAVKTIKHEWTYEHLNQIANHVATILLKKCGSRPRRVGLLFEQDAPMVAGILGTIKAGNTYIPLDPTYPVQRLGYMAEDSRVEMLLTNDINLPLAKKLTGESVALINIDEIDFSGKIDNQSVYVDPDSLAYILYTSGSTGRPKGIMQNHRNVLHFIRVYTNALHISNEDRLTLISSYSFDAAVMDIYGALLNGATLYPVNIREEGLIDLPSWLIEQKVSIYHSTPTVYRAFIDTLTESDIFPQIRLIILGGEAVYKRDVDSYKRHFGTHCLFVNGFGPTESTVSVQYFLDKQTEVQKDRVPIGYAVEDTEILLLNRYGAYDDVHGEIAIRSPHVALGYWNKSEETENAFLPDADGGKRRVYRTGDMGRWLPNGSLEFLGRKDFQIKIRGYRIETAEIENTLLEHPEIKGVSVVTKMINGDSRLVAYIVTHKVQSLEDLNLRQFLQAKLPNYMIPSAFVILDHLPLTPTKKIDRKKLEQLEVECASEQGYVAPRTETEQKIAAIWQEVLNREKVGVHDDFFELGGHSLLATQVVSRINQLFKLQLPLRRFFESKTIEALAEVIDISLWNAQDLQRPIIPGIEEREVFEL